MDGSSATQPLGTQIACSALGLETVWSDRWGVERRLVPADAVAETPDPRTAWVRENVRHRGTGAAYRALLAREADLLLVTRRPAPEEERAARAAGFALDVRPVALDALVFLVHAENPVRDLTAEELRSLFIGAVGNWGAVGGRYGEVHPVVRPAGAPEQELLAALLLGTARAEGRGVQLATQAEVVAALVRRDPAAIGYGRYVYERFVRPEPETRLLAVGGVEPTAETIRAGAYPYVDPVYVVTRAGTPPASSAGMLRRWLLSGGGQAAVAASGFVSVPEWLWIERPDREGAAPGGQ